MIDLSSTSFSLDGRQVRSVSDHTSGCFWVVAAVVVTRHVNSKNARGDRLQEKNDKWSFCFLFFFRTENKKDRIQVLPGRENSIVRGRGLLRNRSPIRSLTNDWRCRHYSRVSFHSFDTCYVVFALNPTPKGELIVSF